MESDITKVLKGFLGEEILITLEADQLNILGQVFRPIFVGRVVDVSPGHVTLNPVTFKMVNAPFFKFPTPLSFSLQKVIGVTPFDNDTIFPLT